MARCLVPRADAKIPTLLDSEKSPAPNTPTPGGRVAMKTPQVIALFTTLLLALSGLAGALFLYLGSRDQTAEAKIEDLQDNLHRIEKILAELTTAQSNSANTIEALSV